MSKCFFQVDISSQKQTNEFYFTNMKPLLDLFLFVFWRKLKTPKRHFEIIWPLQKSSSVEICSIVIEFYTEGRVDCSRKSKFPNLSDRCCKYNLFDCFLHDLHRALMNTSSSNHNVQFSLALFDVELTSFFLPWKNLNKKLQSYQIHTIFCSITYKDKGKLSKIILERV